MATKRIVCQQGLPRWVMMIHKVEMYPRIVTKICIPRKFPYKPHLQPHDGTLKWALEILGDHHQWSLVTTTSDGSLGPWGPPAVMEVAKAQRNGPLAWTERLRTLDLWRPRRRPWWKNRETVVDSKGWRPWLIWVDANNGWQRWQWPQWGQM